MLVTYVPFNTNKLSRVIDATANAAGFPGMSTAQSYGYDSNGRLVQDPQEGLAIDWLPFDKPWKVTKTNGSVFEYGYDALHNRVEKITLSNNERSAYIRDASGNIVALYEYKNGLWFWREQHLYGIDRVGVEKIVSEVIVTQVPIYVDCPPATPAPCIVGDTYVNTIQYQYTGTKYYELTNHLGNVMVVITDQVSAVGTLVLPTVVSATDYYSACAERSRSVGVEMTGRTFSSDAYSFGFNTQIESPEIAPGHTTAMYWEYDSRIGRRWELDPKTVTGWSGYACLGDSPIGMVDWLGDKADGIIIDENGKVIGNDGKVDGKLYVINTTDVSYTNNGKVIPAAGLDVATAKKMKKFIKEKSGNTEAFESNKSLYDNLTEIKPNESARNEMVETVSLDNGKGGTSDNNNREHGGCVKLSQCVLPDKPGDVVKRPANGTERERETIDNAMCYFHSHPSGTLTETEVNQDAGNSGGSFGIGNTTTEFFQQPPSTGDLLTTETGMVNYVFAMGEKMVYLYTNEKVVAKIHIQYLLNPTVMKNNKLILSLICVLSFIFSFSVNGQRVDTSDVYLKGLKLYMARLNDFDKHFNKEVSADTVFVVQEDHLGDYTGFSHERFVVKMVDWNFIKSEVRRKKSFGYVRILPIEKDGDSYFFHISSFSIIRKHGKNFLSNTLDGLKARIIYNPVFMFDCVVERYDL